MKKLLAFLLSVGMLALLGCDAGGTTPTKPDQSDPVPTRPAYIEVVDYDAPALKVTVTINPELELTLSYTHEILEVKALNPDGEVLLEDLDLIGHTYEEGIASILDEAAQHGFLKNAAEVSITVKETADGGVGAHTADVLNQPVLEYRQDSGLLFSCQVDCEDATINSQTLKLVNEIIDGEYVFREYADSSGVVRKHVQINGSDSVVTQYYPNGVSLNGDMFQIIEYTDGRCDYSSVENGICNGYIQYSDGTRDTYVHVINKEDGAITYSLDTYADGSSTERFYDHYGYLLRSINMMVDGTKHEMFLENEHPLRTITYHPDGTKTETQYLYENGDEVGYITTHPDGTTSEVMYEHDAGGISHEYIVNEDGSVYERFLENGCVVRIFERTSDGVVFDTHYYPNGREKSFEVTRPNGNHAITTYYDNGNISSIISQMDGELFERQFDEEERITYEFERKVDGSEYLWDYENGVALGYTVTYPDGTTEYIPRG